MLFPPSFYLKQTYLIYILMLTLHFDSNIGNDVS